VRQSYDSRGGARAAGHVLTGCSPCGVRNMRHIGCSTYLIPYLIQSSAGINLKQTMSDCNCDTMVLDAMGKDDELVAILEKSLVYKYSDKKDFLRDVLLDTTHPCKEVSDELMLSSLMVLTDCYEKEPQVGLGKFNKGIAFERGPPQSSPKSSRQSSPQPQEQPQSRSDQQPKIRRPQPQPLSDPKLIDIGLKRPVEDYYRRRINPKGYALLHCLSIVEIIDIRLIGSSLAVSLLISGAQTPMRFEHFDVWDCTNGREKMLEFYAKLSPQARRNRLRTSAAIFYLHLETLMEEEKEHKARRAITNIE
jgi:hypothetical protein